MSAIAAILAWVRERLELVDSRRISKQSTPDDEKFAAERSGRVVVGRELVRGRM